MYYIYRHILAVVHFNSNLHRDVKVDQNNLERIKVSYPKFKNGEATVRDERVKPNFGKLNMLIHYLMMANY